MTLIWFAVTAVVAYLILTLYLSLLVQQIPRRPVSDPPDWGTIEDTFVPAIAFPGSQLCLYPAGPAESLPVV